MSAALSIDRLPSIVTIAAASRLGIPRRQLYAWRDEGALVPLGRGLFMKEGTEGDPDLIEIAVRAPGATLCSTSSLARHGLTDQIPDSIHVALERGRRPPRTAAPVTWHRFDESTFSVDRSEFEVAEGHRLGSYGPARSVIDAFRLRHLEGHDVAIEALKRWLRQRGTQPASLLAMARSYFPMTEKAIQTALEVLL